MQNGDPPLSAFGAFLLKKAWKHEVLFWKAEESQLLFEWKYNVQNCLVNHQTPHRLKHQTWRALYHCSQRLYLRHTVSSMILYSNELSMFASLRSIFLAWLATVLISHFEFVMNRFRLLWSFLSMKSSFMLFTSCSPPPATIRPKAVLQKFSYCGLLKDFLNFEKMFLILRGTPAINPNMNYNM